jgi:glutaredoxin
MTPITRMKTVVLYGRPGCHLCDDARAALKKFQAERPFLLQEVNIEDDEALFRRHLERIPVVAVDGREVCTLFVDEEALRATL